MVVNPNKNDVLNRYVLATGSDGYKVVFSLGELNPNFGNRPDLTGSLNPSRGLDRRTWIDLRGRFFARRALESVD
jgi:hypothetical protein